ncbi:hypothetical protein SDC9_183336 [bioreactor metagenome]|uniref:Uncharacterized protein n=1 Tax=bioreactor metagenome TaxID=1076179 RepID=A0A645HI86_9ZZZZ
MYALCNDDSGQMSKIKFERLLDFFFGCRIDCAGRIIENKNFRLFQKCAGDAKPLLLAARNIDAALSQIRIVTVWERHDEIVRLRRFARSRDFFVGCVFVAPFHIFPDGAGKQNVFLQHHAHRIVQIVQLIGFNVGASDEYPPLADVI